MSKCCALLFALVFLAASCVIVAKPVCGTSVVGNSWVEKAPMPTARGGLGVAVVNGKIYAIGGLTVQVSLSSLVSGTVVGTNEEYDPATNTWVTKAPMPTHRAYFAVAVFQNKVYCIGGSVAVFFDPYETLTGVNEVYDPATNTWRTLSPMPIAMCGLQANVVGDKIYLMGGYPEVNLTEVYDPANDSWTMKAAMPTPTSSGFITYSWGYYGTFSYTSTVFDGKIYVIGGYGTGKQLEIYDPETDNWSSGTPPPDSFSRVAVATTGARAPERIYVLNGWDSLNGGGATDIYNPKNDSWTVGANIPTGRLDFGVAVVNDTLYVIGGVIVTYPFPFDDPGPDNDNPTAVNEQYTPAGYGTPDPSYLLEHTPPKISLLSPMNQTYNESSFSLNFTLNKPVSWISYSLDGKGNVTINGNTTITGLSSGLHNITVYANDTFGNIGASQTISFTLAKPEPFPTLVVTAVISVAVAISVSLLIHRRYRKTSN